MSLTDLELCFLVIRLIPCSSAPRRASKRKTYVKRVSFLLTNAVWFHSDKNRTILFEPNLNELGANLSHVLTTAGLNCYNRLLVIVYCGPDLWKIIKHKQGVWRLSRLFVTGDGRMHGRVRDKKRLLSNAWVLLWIPTRRQGDFVVRMVVLGGEGEIDTKFK